MLKKILSMDNENNIRYCEIEEDLIPIQDWNEYYIYDEDEKCFKGSEEKCGRKLTIEDYNFVVSHPFSVISRRNGKITQDTTAVEKRNKEIEIANEIRSLKSYLSETDYVISKLNEFKLEDDEEYEKAKAEYAEVLAKRKEARARINELEAQEAKQG